MRMVAVDQYGVEHPIASQSARGTNDEPMLMFKLPAGDFLAFRKQTRPYYWVEFRNVSLQPGHKTNVKVVSLGEPVEKEATPSAGGVGGKPVQRGSAKIPAAEGDESKVPALPKPIPPDAVGLYRKIRDLQMKYIAEVMDRQQSGKQMPLAEAIKSERNFSDQMKPLYERLETLLAGTVGEEPLRRSQELLSAAQSLDPSGGGRDEARWQQTLDEMMPRSTNLPS